VSEHPNPKLYSGRVTRRNKFSGREFPLRPHLLSTVTGPAHRVVNTWEPNRDVLDVKSNQTLTGTELSRYDHTVNAIGQRTAVDATGSAYASLLGGSPWNGKNGDSLFAKRKTGTAFLQKSHQCF